MTSVMVMVQQHYSPWRKWNPLLLGHAHCLCPRTITAMTTRFGFVSSFTWVSRGSMCWHVLDLLIFYAQFLWVYFACYDRRWGLHDCGDRLIFVWTHPRFDWPLMGSWFGGRKKEGETQCQLLNIAEWCSGNFEWLFLVVSFAKCLSHSSRFLPSKVFCRLFKNHLFILLRVIIWASFKDLIQLQYGLAFIDK